MSQTYTVQDVELKLENGSRHPPGSTVTSDELTDREEKVHRENGRLDPHDTAAESEGTVTHDVPPDDEADEDDTQPSDEDEELDWENDYHDAQAKASELDLDAQGTHEEIKQSIREAQ